jgi:hypothetical protein
MRRKRTPIVDALEPISPDNGFKHTATTRYWLLPLATAMTGYTVKAMRRKIERGEWIEGRVWIRAPDGRILISIAGFEKWVEGR